MKKKTKAPKVNKQMIESLLKGPNEDTRLVQAHVDRELFEEAQAVLRSKRISIKDYIARCFQLLIEMEKR